MVDLGEALLTLEVILFKQDFYLKKKKKNLFSFDGGRLAKEAHTSEDVKGLDESCPPLPLPTHTPQPLFLEQIICFSSPAGPAEVRARCVRACVLGPLRACDKRFRFNIQVHGLMIVKNVFI